MARETYAQQIERRTARYYELYPQGVTGKGATAAEAHKFARRHLLTAEHGTTHVQQLPGVRGGEVHTTISAQAATREINRAAREGKRISVTVWDKNHPLGTRGMQAWENRGHKPGISADVVKREIKASGETLRRFLEGTQFGYPPVRPDGITGFQVTVYP